MPGGCKAIYFVYEYGCVWSHVCVVDVELCVFFSVGEKNVFVFYEVSDNFLFAVDGEADTLSKVVPDFGVAYTCGF